MFRSLIYIVFVVATVSSCNSRHARQPVEKKIFAHDAVDTSEGVRKTLEEVFPDGSIPIYHLEKDLFIGVVEDFKNNRILLIRPLQWDGEIEIKRNGKLISLPLEELTIKIYGGLVTEFGTEEDRSETHEFSLGYFIPLTEKDSFALSAELLPPVHCTITVSRSPREGWHYTVMRKKPNPVE